LNQLRQDYCIYKTTQQFLKSGQCNSRALPGKDGLSESAFRDIVDGSEYVLTYVDKEGDWMLVGDVPWE